MEVSDFEKPLISAKLDHFEIQVSLSESHFIMIQTRGSCSLALLKVEHVFADLVIALEQAIFLRPFTNR